MNISMKIDFQMSIQNIRVDAPVTRRTPHSPVREGFPHTVPQ